MRTIFITGISRGLGLITATHFLRRGDRVLALSRSCPPELEKIINEYPDRLLWRSFDLLDVDGIEERLPAVLPVKSEKIDIFIDNAAVALQNLIHNADARKIADLVTLNTTVPMILTKMVINNFLRFRTKGVILHMSSICAHKAYRGLAMLGATKAALETFSRNTAAEYGRFGIRSNTIVAGLLETGMISLTNAQQENEMKNDAALRKLVDTDSVVSLIDYLVSDASHCITGQSVHLDAGIL